MYDRIGSSTSTNDYLRYAIVESPDNVKWKLWLVSSRIMLNQGMMDEARLCIERACVEVPQKQLSNTLLEYAKYFEMIEEPKRALQIMSHTKSQCKNEWKIQFEAVMMLMRFGQF